MPYISRMRQALYDGLQREMAHAIDHTHDQSGDLNYILTRTIIEYLVRGERINYERLNAVLGVLDAVAREFYEQVVRPYEDYKKLVNGDVYADIRARINAENSNPV